MTARSRHSTCATACNAAESAPIGAISDSTTQAAKNIGIRRRSILGASGYLFVSVANLSRSPEKLMSCPRFRY
jgi:hypothetical protein